VRRRISILGGLALIWYGRTACSLFYDTEISFGAALEDR
jgi:hypothetical protein